VHLIQEQKRDELIKIQLS